MMNCETASVKILSDEKISGELAAHLAECPECAALAGEWKKIRSLPLEEKCREGFRLTYEDEGWLYVAVGYGARSGGGYSVQVCACRETENAIYVHTTLLGPDSGDAQGGGDTYPCIVLKMEAREKHVVFQ